MTESNEKNTPLEKDNTLKFPHYLNDKRLTREEFNAEYEDWIEKVLKKELSTEPPK